VKTAWRAVQMVDEDSNHGGLEKWLVRTPTTAAVQSASTGSA